jgi:hypothetical protein
MINQSDKSFSWPDHRCWIGWRAHWRDELGFELALERSKVLRECWRASQLYDLRVRLWAALARLAEDSSLLAETLIEILEISED